MTSTKNQAKGISFQGLDYYPWESQLNRFLTPFQEFDQRQTVGGILLFLAGTTALLMMNSPLQGAYEKIIQLPIIIQIGHWNKHFTILQLVNEGLMIFLVSLAIVDDIGAVLVIAIFYTTSLNFAPLEGAVFFFFLLMFMNLGGVRNRLPYLIIGVSTWLLFLTSGVCKIFSICRWPSWL